MEKKILISTLLDEYRIAVIEDDVLVEFYIERPDRIKSVGSIYKGAVVSVNPELNAAFVNIGAERSAFLPLSEEIIELGEISPGFPEHKKLSRGDEILVQVTKEGIGDKGAMLTQYCSLPGRYLVLMKGAKHIGVSKRILIPRERYRLKKLVEDIKPKDVGIIVRTASQGVNANELKRDLKILLKKWRKLETLASKKTAPFLLHREVDFITAFARDNFSPDVGSIITDSKATYKKILGYAKRFAPKYIPKISLHDSKTPLFDVYKVGESLRRSFEKKIKLPSRGYIVIDETEALVAIDVNSGSSKKHKDMESLSLGVNLEAAKEVARQLRLRDKGGVIVVDFIDMKDPAHKRKVLSTLKKEFKKDKAPTRVYGMSEIGLVQITRKRAHFSLGQILFDPCPVCEGRGYIPSIPNITSKLEQVLLSLPRGIHTEVRAKEEIIDYLKTIDWNKLRRIMRMKRIHIRFESDSGVNYGEVILRNLDSEKDYRIKSSLYETQ